MPAGGARPGAGRKPKSEVYIGPIREVEAWIVDKLPAIREAMLDLALGEKGEDGKYKRLPDRGACEYLTNRIMGKPTESVDVTSDGEQIGVLGIDDMARRAILAAAEELNRP